MKKIQVIVTHDDHSDSFDITSEKVILGRDSKCDIAIDDVAVSRRHAALIARMDSVYIENISPSGQVIKGGAPTEYAELHEGEEFQIGPFTLYWQYAQESTTKEPAADTENGEEESSEEENGYEMQVMDAALMPDEDDNPEDEMGLVEQGFDGNALSAEIVTDEDPDNHAIAEQGFDEDFPEATQITNQGNTPKLRITEGEKVGREIKLEMGTAWVIGRSKKAHIQIESKKISRQHFKIVKIADKYRVQDMGSSTGTKVNGVTVADAPLQPFDSIKAGNVELQFLLSNSEMEHLQAGQLEAPDSHALATQGEFSGGQGKDNSTIVNMPVPYDPSREEEKFAEDKVDLEEIEDLAEEEELKQFEDGKVPLAVKLRIRKRKLIREWQKLPKQKRMIYGSAAALVLFFALMSGSEPPQEKITAAVPDTAANSGVNTAQSPDISPTFYALSIDKQDKIRELYQKAELAAKKKQWKAAFDASSKVLESVDKYKKSKEIMLQAQAFLNDKMIDNLSNSVGDAEKAAKAAREKVAYLIDTGTVALRNSKWKKAEESFVSALTLDPTNKEAEHGLAAARSKDPLAMNNFSGEEGLVKLDPDYEARQIEEEYIQTFEDRYSTASQYILGSNYDEAVSILEDLYEKLAIAFDAYKSGRGPASVRPQYIEAVRGLQSKTQEAYNQIEQNLSIEYQTQIADAEQYLSNRQYVMARRTYDKILQDAPYFHQIQKMRKQLYTKIVVVAKNLYRAALVYESIGNIDAATSNLKKAKDLLTDVNDYEALDYYRKTNKRLLELQG